MVSKDRVLAFPNSKSFPESRMPSLNASTTGPHIFSNKFAGPNELLLQSIFFCKSLRIHVWYISPTFGIIWLKIMVNVSWIDQSHGSYGNDSDGSKTDMTQLKSVGWGTWLWWYYGQGGATKRWPEILFLALKKDWIYLDGKWCLFWLPRKGFHLT